ncbi:MAG: SRPBCC domain-containing protein [Alphaproteobacteria bacterium]|nr:SRPBCC domain-containing protein [Alphaproteobacteria bacterium]
MSVAQTGEFTITRSFDAPRDKVWKAWTDADSLEQWWGPKGCTLRVVKFDLRPGGMFHYAMEFQSGRPMYGRFVYREIAAPERLVYVSSFSDAEGVIARAPFPQIKDSWPLEVLNTLPLGEDGDRTPLTLRAHPLNGSAAEIDTFIGMFDSMLQGFGGTFEQLETHLSKT